MRERYFKSVPTQAAGARDRAFPPPSLSSPFCFPVPPPPPLPIVPPPLTRPSVRPSVPGHRSRISSTTWSSSAFGRRRRRRARGFQKYSGGRRGAGEGGQLDGCMGGHTYVRRVVLHTTLHGQGGKRGGGVLVFFPGRRRPSIRASKGEQRTVDVDSPSLRRT